MNPIITAVEKYLGPKLAAVVTSATVAVGQISSALGASDGASVTDILINAAQTDLVSFLPAPIAGVLGYFLRSTDKPVVVDKELEAHKAKERIAKYDELAAHLDHLQDKYEALDESQVQLDNELSSTEATIESLIHRIEKLEGSVEPLPLNLRQNNPGNIESTLPGGNRWNGELDSDNRYAVFETPAHGVRAMLYLLRKVYYQRHKLLNIQDIIHRWAPLGDNSPESVDNYINHVAKALNVTSIVDLHLNGNDERLVAMLKAMAEFEGGRPLPYSKEVYTKALELLA